MMKLEHYRPMGNVRLETLAIVFAEDDEEGSDGPPPEIIVEGDPWR